MPIVGDMMDKYQDTKDQQRMERIQAKADLLAQKRDVSASQVNGIISELQQTAQSDPSVYKRLEAVRQKAQNLTNLGLAQDKQITEERTGQTDEVSSNDMAGQIDRVVSEARTSAAPDAVNIKPTTYKANLTKGGNSNGL